MQNDFSRYSDFDFRDAQTVSEGEMAARVWLKLLGGSPHDFYDRVSPEGKVAIRKSLVEELNRAHADNRKALAEQENSSKSYIRDGKTQDQAVVADARPGGYRINGVRGGGEPGGGEPGGGDPGGADEGGNRNRAEYGEKQDDGELAERAWGDATRFGADTAYWLKPDLLARAEEEHANEALKIQEEDKASLSPELKAHYLESSDYLRGAYDGWVQERAHRVFQGRHYKFDEIDEKYKDNLIERWRENISQLREERYLRTSDEDLAELEAAREESNVNKFLYGGEAFITVSEHQHLEKNFERDRSGAESDQSFQQVVLDEERVIETVQLETEGQTKILPHEWKDQSKTKDILDSVSKWWNREKGRSLFGPDVQVLDYPREAEIERLVESCADDYDFDIELDVHDLLPGEDHFAVIGSSRSGDNSGAERDISQLLCDDGISFDEMNRPGSDGPDEQERSKDDNLEFDRSSWIDRSR